MDELLASGAPYWAFQTYETLAGVAVAFATGSLLTGFAATFARFRRVPVRAGWVPDALALVGLVGLLAWSVSGFSQSTPPPDGQFCYTPSSWSVELEPVCHAGWAMETLVAPLAWLVLPSLAGLALRALSVGHWRALLYGSMLALGGIALIGRVGFLAQGIVVGGGFFPASYCAFMLALGEESLGGAFLGFVVFALSHLYLHRDDLFP